MIIETMVEVFNSRQEEITGVKDLTLAKFAFNTEDVIAVREETYNDSSDIDPEMCNISLRNGENFTIYTPYKDMLKHLNYKPEKNYNAL